MLYEGPPDNPTAERFWQMIEHRVTTFGISPTAIRLLMRKAGSGPDGFDLGSLRLLGSGVPESWYADAHGLHVGGSLKAADEMEQTRKESGPVVGDGGDCGLLGNSSRFVDQSGFDRGATNVDAKVVHINV